MSIPTIQFAPDYTISRIIKGGWQLAGGHGAVDHGQAIDDMMAFVDAGITTFDCADIYTGVEELIGDFRKEYRRARGKEALARLKVHTKCVPDLAALATVSRRDVEQIIDRSLSRLQIERLDLVQFHFWDYEIPRYTEVVQYLSEFQRAGKIHLIGVTNFDVPHLKELIDAGVSVVSNQVQYSVLDQRPEHGMAEFCSRHAVKLLCYGTVAGGFLSSAYLGVPEPTAPLENRSLTKYKLIIDEFGGWELFQELQKTLQKIAARHGTSITNVATRFVLDQPGVAAAIVGARNRTHLSEAAALGALTLSNEDRGAIREIIARAKGPQGDTYDLERIKGGKHASIMKYNLNKK